MDPPLADRQLVPGEALFLDRVEGVLAYRVLGALDHRLGIGLLGIEGHEYRSSDRSYPHRFDSRGLGDAEGDLVSRVVEIRDGSIAKPDATGKRMGDFAGKNIIGRA
jgi:hypothetical protein